MSTRYLLDTSVLLLILKKDTIARHKLTIIGTENAYVACISLGELYYKEIVHNRTEELADSFYHRECHHIVCSPGFLQNLF